VGMLRAWGADVDPITVACMLMTIGFSVYYTARVCFCYQRLPVSWLPEKKLRTTLGQVGWPVLQVYCTLETQFSFSEAAKSSKLST